jgi:hypothetical protein
MDGVQSNEAPPETLQISSPERSTTTETSGKRSRRTALTKNACSECRRSKCKVRLLLLLRGSFPTHSSHNLHFTSAQIAYLSHLVRWCSACVFSMLETRYRMPIRGRRGGHHEDAADGAATAFRQRRSPNSDGAFRSVALRPG